MKEPALIPDVAELKRFNGEFSLTPASFIAAAPGTEEAAELLREYLSIPTGFDEIPVVPEPAAGDGGIHLRVAGEPEPDRVGLCDESYRLAVRTDAVEISAANRFGLLRAIQTLRQLLPPEIYTAGKTGLPAWSIPCLQLEDAPEFRWRGMHFDVARHFFTVPEVCRYIELLAQHKFNVLHWHLTDDQGWRVEIKSYPRLTRIGAFRKRSQDINPERTPVFDNVAHGGFYTQDDIAEIVGFAARRGITVVPEIDMPGHIQSAIAAYPELGNNPAVNPGVMEAWGTSSVVLSPEESTFEFIEKVLDEIMALFPSRVIHIGGDEVNFDEWSGSPLVKRLIEANGLASLREFEYWFMARVANFVSSRGRIPAGWDGGIPLRGVLNTAWLGKRGTLISARLGELTVAANCDRFYFDHYQSAPEGEPPAYDRKVVQTCEAVYDYHIVPDELENRFACNIIGGQGALWTEHIPDFRQVEYMLFPRACALAEKLWRRQEDCDFADFVVRLRRHRSRLEAGQVNAHRLPQ